MARAEVRVSLKDVPEIKALIERLTERAETAEAAIERAREAVNVFCHGEQAYAEHEHYCMPILAALDGTEAAGGTR